MHTVVKCSLFRNGAGMWGLFDVETIKHRPCIRLSIMAMQQALREI